MPRKKQTYESAVIEIEQILNQLEEGSIGVDTLMEKVKRATELIRFCKAKLQETEDDVKSILESNENEK